MEEVIKQVDGAKIDSFTFHMGVNATPSVGRTRMAAPLANSLDRLLLDSEKAHRLAEKLEEDLMGDDEEPVTGEGDGAEVPSKPREIKLAGLRERGTTVVQNRIDQLLEDQGLIGDELDQAQKLRKVCCVADSVTLMLTSHRRSSWLITGSRTCETGFPHVTTALPRPLSQKRCIESVSPIYDHTPKSTYPLRRLMQTICTPTLGRGLPSMGRMKIAGTSKRMADQSQRSGKGGAATSSRAKTRSGKKMWTPSSDRCSRSSM